MKKYVISFSGGLASAECAYRKKAKHGTDNLILLFADTLVEDDDLYRFVLQVAADIYSVDFEFKIDLPSLKNEEKRKEALSLLRKTAKEKIPGLEWIADGRNIWDVFFDQHMIGNNRVDPCSQDLKRKICKKWLDQNCSNGQAVISIGYDWGEADRFEKAQKYWRKWTMDAPMMEPPYLHKSQLMNLFQSRGIEPPRLYFNGFPHNNCAGACVRSGLDQWRAVLDLFPDIYAYHESKEKLFREKFGDYSILRDQSNNKTIPRTLTSLRKEWLNWPAKVRAHKRKLWDSPLQIPIFTADTEMTDWGGCGCFSPPEPNQ